MRSHKLYMKFSHIGIFIEIFDAKVLYAIYPMAYISRQHGTSFFSCFIKSNLILFFFYSILGQNLGIFDFRFYRELHCVYFYSEKM